MGRQLSLPQVQKLKHKN